MKILLELLILTFVAYGFSEEISVDVNQIFETAFIDSEDNTKLDFLSNENDDYEATNKADEYILEDDRSRTRNIFCKVDKTTKKYVKKCSSFKRKRIRALCKKIRINVCSNQQKLVRIGDELEYDLSDLLLNVEDEITSEKTDESFLMADRPEIIKLFCHVDKKNYVWECSSFKRKKEQSLCQKARKNHCGHRLQDNTDNLVQNYLVANDVDKLNSEETEDNYLEADMSGIIKLFCQVDKTTKNYVRQCSFFKRKKIQKICEKTRKNFCSSLQNLFYDESSLDNPYKQPDLIFNGDDRKDLVNKHTYAKFQYLLCEVFEFDNFNCSRVRNSKLRKFCNHLQKKNYCGKGQFYGIGDENSD